MDLLSKAMILIREPALRPYYPYIDIFLVSFLFGMNKTIGKLVETKGQKDLYTIPTSAKTS